MRTVYLDFDGTVIDVWKRYFQVLNDFLILNSLCGINMEEYKGRKKKRLFDHEIVKELSGQDIDVEKYIKFKKGKLETKKYLDLDMLIGKPSQYVGTFHQLGFYVEILTQRHNKNGFFEQIEQLGISSAFDAYTIVAPSKEKNAKYQYLCCKLRQGDIMVGDGPVEKECAEKCNVPFLFVDSGLYTAESIGVKKTYKDIMEIEKFLTKGFSDI